MKDPVAAAQEQWDAFLEKWPLSELETMSLDAYTNLERTSFTYSLEVGTPLLGSITGGNAAKFGIYRMAGSEKRVQKTANDGTYCRQTRFGNATQTAFENVREALVTTARLAQAGNYDALDQLDEKLSLAPVVRWKVAFIYQDRDNVGVLPIYAPDLLMYLASPYVAEVSKTALAPLHRALIHRPEASALAFPFANAAALQQGLPSLRKTHWLVRLDAETLEKVQGQKKVTRGMVSETVFQRMQKATMKVNDQVAFVAEDRVVSRGTLRGYNPNSLVWTQQTVHRKLTHTVDKVLLLEDAESDAYFGRQVSPGAEDAAQMGLIAGVVIKSFRSIYQLELTGCRKLNVLSGRNDVGKSNILRALQLFFNNEADWRKPLLFLRDFNNKRRKSSSKRRLIIEVAVTFHRPASYANSLPPVFTVTRTWDLHGQRQETHDLDKQHKAGLVPSSLNTAQAQLTRFMNNLHFEYVPAVKDRAYFEHLLEKLQTGILAAGFKEDMTLGRYADDLANHIQNQLPALKDDFAQATTLETLIAPPEDPIDYFQSFRVTTQTPYGQVPLLSRGDGMQARYVSSVLHFVATKSRQNIIWGFEEPENSLEFAHCDRLAASFSAYAGTVQIFTTSHSPAFLSLEKTDGCRLYRVYQEDNDTHAVAANTLNDLHEELGVLRIHQELYEEFKMRMDALAREKVARENAQRELLAVMAELKNSKKPVVLTEGKTDGAVLGVAWERLYGQKPMPFVLRVGDTLQGQAGGAGGADAVSMMLRSVHPEEQRLFIGIFDRDKAGLNAFGLDRNFKAWCGRDDVKAHDNGVAFGMLLPLPTFRRYDGDLESKEFERQLFLEHMFSDEALATEVDGEAFSSKLPKAIDLGGVRFTQDEDGYHKARLEGKVLRRVDDSKKDFFATKVVPTLDPQEFEAFRPLFDTILAILKDPAAHRTA